MPNSINPVPIFRALVYPKDRRIDFAYWQNRALASVKDHGAGSDIADYDYIGSRVLKRTMQNGVNLDFENGSGTYYDSLGRPTTWKHVKSGTTKIGFDLTYDRAGNPTAISLLHDTGKGSFSSIGYDSANRLLSSTHAGAWSGQPLAEDWTLDGLGNMKYVDGYTTGSRLTTSFNEYYSVAGVTNTQDDNGNLTSDGTLTYKWDGFNRLSEVKNGGTTVADYYYDAEGRRVAKKVSGTSNYYALDGWREIAEYTDGNANPDREFVYGAFIDEPLVLDSNDSFDSSCTGAGDSRYFYHQNWEYSVCALTNGSGTVVEGYEYEPYGRHRVFFHSGISINFNSADTITDLGSSHFGNPFLYTGRRFDSETKLQYSRHRYYSQAEMRFLSRDYLFEEGEMHSYSYARLSPILKLDLNGTLTIDPIKGPHRPPKKYPNNCPMTRCGPDVTQQLKNLKVKVQNDWASWASIENLQATKCDDIVNINGFDTSLGPMDDGEPWECAHADGPCSTTVRVSGTCHSAFAVNYILFGWAAQLCTSAGYHSLTYYDSWAWVGAHRNTSSPVHRNATGDEKYSWYVAGKNGWPSAHNGTASKDLLRCNKCPDDCKFKKGEDMIYRWMPHDNIGRPYLANY